MSDENVLERKTPPKASDRGEQMDEFTYIPGYGDPAHTSVGGDGTLGPDGLPLNGYKFLAHVPVKLPRKTTTVKVLLRQERETADGRTVSAAIERDVPLHDLLKDNPCFGVNGKPPRTRGAPMAKLPTDPDQYRGYAIGWMRESRDAPTLKSRWDGEQALRDRLGVNHADLAYIVPFMEGRLIEMGGARHIELLPPETPA